MMTHMTVLMMTHMTVLMMTHMTVLYPCTHTQHTHHAVLACMQCNVMTSLMSILIARVAQLQIHTYGADKVNSLSPLPPHSPLSSPTWCIPSCLGSRYDEHTRVAVTAMGASRQPRVRPEFFGTLKVNTWN